MLHTASSEKRSSMRLYEGCASGFGEAVLRCLGEYSLSDPRSPQGEFVERVNYVQCAPTDPLVCPLLLVGDAPSFRPWPSRVRLMKSICALFNAECFEIHLRAGQTGSCVLCGSKILG